MTRIIKITPRELIKHLEWTPEMALPKLPKKPKTPAHNPSPGASNSIDELLGGKDFYDGSMPTALRKALEYSTTEGIVLTMPELLAAKAKSNKRHRYWKDWYTVHTEENIGLDAKGTYCAKNEPVLVVVHGGGILTPERIEQAFKPEGMINGSAKYQPQEFADLLQGKLADGKSIQLYRFEELQKLTSVPHQFGVVMPYSVAQGTKSGYHQKKEFLENPLVLARAGTIEHLERFYEKAKDGDGDVGNHHPFEGRNASVPQGRVLFLDGNCGGLVGIDDLSSVGRFVGVAPEAHRAARKK